MLTKMNSATQTNSNNQLWNQLDDKKAEKVRGGAPQGESVGLVGTGGAGCSYSLKG
jgi:hypothetical protein